MFMVGISGIIPGVNSVAVGAPDGTDPYWTNTILLCGCEGTNGTDANLVDESFAARANGVSGGGGVTDSTYSTAQKMFGTSSLYLDTASNDWVTFADHADWTLGSADFTIEFFIYFNGVAQLEQGSTIMSHWDSGGNQRGWNLKYDGSGGTNLLRFFGSADGSATTTFLDYTWTPSTGQWYYICVDRSGNSFRMYLGTPGGTASMVASATNAISFFNASAPLHISGVGSLSHEALNDVFMDEIRMTSLARYATDAGFPVPTARFPRS